MNYSRYHNKPNYFCGYENKQADLKPRELLGHP